MLRRLEINVETCQIQKWELQIFRARIIDVRDQRAGILRFGRSIEPLEEFLNATAAVPAHDGAGNFVSDRVAQNRRMSGACTHSRAHTLSDGMDSSGIVKERYVLFPRDSNHYA